MIDIRVLGVVGGMPMPDSHLASVILSYNGGKILVDCGEGTQVSMRKYNTGFKRIDLILITHIHGDHINGIPGLLVTMGNCGRLEKLTIAGPIGIKQVMDAIRVLIPFLPYEIEVIEIEDNNFNYKYNDIYINVEYLDHSSPCIGYTFELPRKGKFIREKAEELNIPVEYWGKLSKGENIKLDNKIIEAKNVLGNERKGIKISYVTDTRPIERIIDFIKDSDIFFCESNYESNEKLNKAIENKHMTYEEAANLALRANVKKLKLIHFSPSIKEPENFINNAKDIFINSSISKEGEVITLKYTE